jgi:tripartite-type tricarboxylate transporter receptor subunit TctC
MQLPSVQNQLAQEWVQTRAMTPPEFTKFVENEVAKWSLAVKTMNIAFQ